MIFPIHFMFLHFTNVKYHLVLILDMKNTKCRFKIFTQILSFSNNFLNRINYIFISSFTI